MKLLTFLIFIALISCSHESTTSSFVNKLESYELINIGEFHGTKETPDFFFSLVSEYVSSTKNQVAIGLEIPISEQSHVTNFLKTGDDQYLSNSSFFTRKYQDGRASIDLVKGLKKIAKHKNLTIFCFDQKLPYNERRDEVMAMNIIAQYKSKKFKKIFTYSGNLHATKEIGTPWEPKRKPMGFFLEKEFGRKAMSIRVEFKEGQSWICNGMTPETCGIKNIGSISSGLAKVGTLKLLNDPQRGYDGFVLIERVTPSLPWRSDLL